MFSNESAYDQEIQDAIGSWSPAYSVTIPVWLVKALIAQESSFNTNATRVEPPSRTFPNGTTSRGLMQVLDETARSLGVSDPQQLYDPAVGISTGVHYLAKLLQRYGGDQIRAVAAYNRGPGNVPITGDFTPGDYADAVFTFARYFAGLAGPVILPGLALAVGVFLLLARMRRA